MSEPVQGVLVAHGELGKAMLDAVKQIAGTNDGLQSLSNRDLSPETLRERLAHLIGQAPSIVFVDLPSGSCALAARYLSSGRTDVAIVSGFNLPMLLDFVFHRDRPLAEVVERLRAHICVTIEGGPDADSTDSG